MFQTCDLARMNIPWAGSDENVWSYVELLVNRVWFYVDCRVSDGESSIGSTFMLAHATQIRNLIAKTEILIKEVYVVLPPYINGSNRWQMEPVQEICTGSVSSDDYVTTVEIYRLIDGRKYYSMADVKDGENIKNLEIIFSTKT